MEAAVISALVAGAVSLVGLLVQLRLAKVTRATALETAATQPIRELERAELLAMADGLRVFRANAETLRIQLWRVLGCLRASAGFNEEVDTYHTLMMLFGQSEGSFRDSWAAVKSALPAGLIVSLREQRHECLNRLGGLSVELQTWAHHPHHDSKEKERQRERLTRLVLDLLSSLDAFIVATNTADLLASSPPIELGARSSGPTSSERSLLPSSSTQRRPAVHPQSSQGRISSA